MSFLGNMLGTTSGFQAQGVTPEQLATAQTNVNSATQQQQQFLSALQAQNGTGNQSSVFNQQQGLAQQLQNVANGSGPNPAQAALNQATGTNVSNQAALMAGQRGTGANAGMLARQAAQQGANIQQQATGQAATMQAQQQMSALSQLQAQQQAMGQTAQNQVGNTQAATSQLNNSATQNQQNLLQMQANANNTNEDMAKANMNANSQMVGGLMSGGGALSSVMGGGGGSGGGGGGGLGSLAMLAAFHKGGMVQKFAQGGDVETQPMSATGRLLAGITQNPQIQRQAVDPVKSQQPTGNAVIGQNIAQAAGAGLGALFAPQPNAQLYGQDGVMNTTSDPSLRLPPGEMMANKGAMVPGKAAVEGNSPKNDTVPAMLSPGEIVIPRSILEGKDPGAMAKKFVEEQLKKKPQAKSHFDEGGEAPLAMTDQPVEVAQQFNPQDIGGLSQITGQPPQAPQLPQAQQPIQPDDLYSKPQQAQVKPLAGFDPNSGLKTMAGGIGQQAKAEGQVAQDQAKIYANAAQHEQDVMTQIQSTADQHNQEVAGIINDLKTQKIDPNQYMANMGTGGHIATAIGLILGGIGGGLTHQANPALAYLNDQINRNIDSQVKNQDNKKTLLGALEKQYGDKQTAMTMLHSVYLGQMADKIQEAANAQGTQLAQGRAAQQIGQLQQMMNQNSLSTAQRQMFMQKQNSAEGPDAIDAVNAGVIPKEYQGDAYKEQSSVDAQKSAVKGVNDLFSKLDKEQSTMNLVNPQSYKRAGALKSELVNTIMNASASKRLTRESIEAEIDPLMVKTGDDKDTRDTKLQALKNLIQKHADPTPLMDKYKLSPKNLYGNSAFTKR